MIFVIAAQTAYATLKHICRCLTPQALNGSRNLPIPPGKLDEYFHLIFKNLRALSHYSSCLFYISWEKIVTEASADIITFENLHFTIWNCIYTWSRNDITNLQETLYLFRLDNIPIFYQICHNLHWHQGLSEDTQASHWESLWPELFN